LDYGWEPVNYEFLQEGAVRNWVAVSLHDQDFKVGQVLQLGYLKQGHDVAFLELQDL